jgi:CMP-N-acetylneuraminic acid synthetase
MKIWGLIPARGGSKRIPGKNFRELGGKTLLSRAIESALEADIFEKIIVSSDAKQAYESIHPYREKSLVVEFRHTAGTGHKVHGDKSNDIDWINDIFDVYGWNECDFYCILRPTNPFRTAKTINKAMDNFLSSKYQPSQHSLKSVQPIREWPQKMWKIMDEKLCPFWQSEKENRNFEKQSSNFDPLWVQNGCIDICRPSNIQYYGGYLGLNIMPFITDWPEGFDINTWYNWNIAEYLIEKGLVK